MRARRAIVRGISQTFQQAVVMKPSDVPIDVERARAQHAAYVRALREADVDVTVLPPLDEHPDACFVEDCAIVGGPLALATRPGAPSRVGEVDSVAEVLAGFLPIERTTAPATIDGGDCLRLGNTFFVGRTPRTNAAGIARLKEVFEPHGHRVVEVPIGDVLHLKCVCARLDDERVLIAKGTVDREVFRGFEVLEIPNEESYAANVLSVNGTVVVADGFPETARVVANAGFRVVPIETTEFRKADGSLTCLSILV